MSTNSSTSCDVCDHKASNLVTLCQLLLQFLFISIGLVSDYMNTGQVHTIQIDTNSFCYNKKKTNNSHDPNVVCLFT